MRVERRSINGALAVLKVLGEAVIASNVLMAGGTGTVALQTCQFSPPPQSERACAMCMCECMLRPATLWLERTFDVLLAALLTTHAHREAPGFKDVVAAIMDSPANPAVLFDANPGNWR